MAGFGVIAATNGAAIRVRVTVDGFVIPELPAINTTEIQYPLDNFLTALAARSVNTFANGGRYRNGELEFKSSLKLEVCNTVGSSTTLHWYVELE